MVRKPKSHDVEALWRSPRELTVRTARAARRARLQLLVLIPAVIGVVLAFQNRKELFGDADLPVRVGTAVGILVLGFWLARDLGRSAEPVLYRRMDRATAGTVSFLIRLIFLTAAILAALRFAGLKPETLAVGGAITAVVVGLAAQQTFGNVLAGLVLISARPFRVGDRVRLQAGGVAGQLEGVVTSVGLLYTIFAQGEDSMMVPNSVVLSAAVVPLREPAGVDLRAKLRPDVLPSEVQGLLEKHVKTATRDAPNIALEEIDADEVVLRITATPEHESDGPRLADEILAAIAPIAREGQTAERLLARSAAGRYGDA
jgi:small-conductance mechanosensitive channel